MDNFSRIYKNTKGHFYLSNYLMGWLLSLHLLWSLLGPGSPARNDTLACIEKQKRANFISVITLLLTQRSLFTTIPIPTVKNLQNLMQPDQAVLQPKKGNIGVYGQKCLWIEQVNLLKRSAVGLDRMPLMPVGQSRSLIYGRKAPVQWFSCPSWISYLLMKDTNKAGELPSNAEKRNNKNFLYGIQKSGYIGIKLCYYDTCYFFLSNKYFFL